MGWRNLPAAVAAFVVLSACGLTSTTSAATGKLAVVAAENFWGSIAAQVGGERVAVRSIIANPAADPHDYDPTATDARALAGAAYVIVNGAGYDAWASRLLAANPAGARKVLVVGDLAGIAAGGNPHVWYLPEVVHRVVDRVAADLTQLDSVDAAYFEQQRSGFKSIALKGYDSAIASIKATYAGTPVGASENVFAYMAAALGLHLITPPGYMKAIAEGAEPSAADKIAVDRQVTQRLIRVFVYNSQNSTPDVQAVVAKARAAGIPVVAMTETLTPPGATFEQWQTAQLRALQSALGG